MGSIWTAGLTDALVKHRIAEARNTDIWTDSISTRETL